MNALSPLDATVLRRPSHAPSTGEPLEGVCESLLHLNHVLEFPRMKEHPFPPLARTVKQNADVYTRQINVSSITEDPNYEEELAERLATHNGTESTLKEYDYLLGETRYFLNQILDTVLGAGVFPEKHPSLTLFQVAQAKEEKAWNTYEQKARFRKKPTLPMYYKKARSYYQLTRYMLVSRFLNFSPSQALLQELVAEFKGFNPFNLLPF
jgi:hypothetical protein